MRHSTPFKRQRRSSSWRKNRASSSKRISVIAVLAVLAVAGSGLFYAYARHLSGSFDNSAGFDLSCFSVSVTDGDTFRCDGIRVRMYGIDAPELEGHCRPGRQCVEGDPIASARNLERLVAGHAVACNAVDVDRYGRTVGHCYAGGVDLSCAQVKDGFAVRRYGILVC